MIEFVSATRGSLKDFKLTQLGQCLSKFSSQPWINARITLDNAKGISEVYNTAIESTQADVLAFVHDDVFVLDPYFADRLNEAVSRFDIVGVVGSTETNPAATTWYTDHSEHSSGGLWIGRPMNLFVFGPSPRSVAVLDGLFLAARTETLRRSGVRFDPQFRFHMYDLDFCRAARNAGLTLGTWPIALLHESPGAYDSPEWTEAKDAYLRKWAAHA